ncbi:MAG: protein NO VEIN domain-containing protein [Isosphaeraceae bacterium]
MSTEKPARLDYEALVVAYAMSRLDQRYLRYRGARTWKQAFEDASTILCIRPSSLKNLRDEFDPIHGNQRKGWHKRPLRPSRLQVLTQLCDLSDDGLLALVAQILHRDADAVSEAVDALVSAHPIAYNVAERLRTGRLAERYFLENCEKIVQIHRSDIIDLRDSACGYDFGIQSRPEVAIETKGLSTSKGGIVFTDREWSEARLRKADFWLVVVGNLNSVPVFRLFHDPFRILKVKCRHSTVISANWHSFISLPPSAG